MDIFTYIIMGLLSVDTIRSIIAMMGLVKPNAKYSWLIYGRFQKNLIETTLNEMGFSSSESKRIKKDLRKVSQKFQNGVTPDNVTKHLIALLAKYIVKFEGKIAYGGTHTTSSQYYINTMEISHCEKDSKILCSAMVNLVDKKSIDNNKPSVVFTPKGGNSLLGMQVAQYYKACYIMAKSETDKSRINTLDHDVGAEFSVNYEGSWETKNIRSKKSIALDCNISGGSQLLDIIDELNTISKKRQLDFNLPNEVYVLFRVDNHKEVDKVFEDRNCSLYRFFDLDEEIKEMLYELKFKCENENIEIDIYDTTVSDEIDRIIHKLKEKNKLYY